MPGGDHVSPVSQGVKLTYDDLLQMPDDGLRHELIDGEHYVTASPNLRHQRLLGRLHIAIAKWLESNPDGEVFVAPVDVVFSQPNVVVPDLLYVSHARGRDVLTPAHVRGAPDLVVEIGSPSTRKRDETLKRRLYERTGVSEYWVVDPDLDVVRVYARATPQDPFSRPRELSADTGDVLTTPLLPGLEIALAALCADPTTA
jgi:Uma2 family endonuclease